MTAPLLRLLLRAPPPQLFFTGKGGVGKTSLACAVAIALADEGKRILLVSTDPASNLDEMFGQALTDTPRPILDVPGLAAMNIDPEAAAEAYSSRVLAQLANRPYPAIAQPAEGVDRVSCRQWMRCVTST